VSGRGTLFSWSTNFHSVLNAFDAAAPYLCVLVELVEQPGLILVSDFAGDPVENPGLRIGMPMQAAFQPTQDPHIVLPQFRVDLLDEDQA
jgi:uncharacterized OB-fold protein